MMGQRGRPRKNPIEPTENQEQVSQETPEVDGEENAFVSPTATPELNPRVHILAELAKRSNERADQEAAEVIPGDDEVSHETEEPEAAAEEPAEPEEIKEPEEEKPSLSFDPEQEYDLTVNGKVIKVKGSQILERGKASIQKEEAADYKLQLASELLKEAQAQRQPVKQEETVPEYTDEQLAEIIQFGTKEQAAEAIRMLRGNKDAENKRLAELATQLPNVINEQIAFQEATKFVQSEYGDLLKDPDLQTLFFAKENGLRSSGDTRTYKELYQSIGDELRVKFNRPKPSDTKTMEEKVEAKRSTPSVPRLASTRMESAPEKKAPTREEVISKMRQARGQLSASNLN